MGPDACRTVANQGGSITEILLVTSICYVPLILSKIFAHGMERYLARRFVLEFGMISIPQIWCVVFPHYCLVTHLGFLLLLLYIMARSRALVQRKSSEPLESQVPAIDVVRSLIGLQTYISILAVDFPVYPRRFEKTECYGTSLMDVGVGCYAFLCGQSTLLRSQKPDLSKSRVNRNYIWLGILAIGRNLFVRITGYPVQVSEYGLDWNFFASLLFISWFTAIATTFVGFRKLPVLVGAVGLVYQMGLCIGLEDYLLGSERTTLLARNKEGVFGLVGHALISIMGFWISGCIEWKSRTKKNLYIILTITATVWICYGFVTKVAGIVPSRRSNNLAFVLWILSFSSTHILICLVLDWSGWIAKCSLFQALAKNSMVTFLFANLVTGIVNLSISTSQCSTAVSVIYICLYMAMVCIFAFGLDNTKINRIS